MKSVVLSQPGQLVLTETPGPDPAKAEEAVVRVRRVGICGTDLRAFKGEQPFFTYPRVLGHELAVEVVSIGKNADGIQTGDACSVEPYLNCGACVACRRGKTNCCARLSVLGVHRDGGMRELITVPVEKLHKSSALSLDQLALVEPLCIGAHAVARAKIEPGEFTLVVGAGPIGLSVIQFARIAGARIIVMEVSEERLDFAAEHFDIEAAIQPGSGAIEHLMGLTAGEMPTVVFDATGNPASMNASFDLTASGGTLVLVGLTQGNLTFDDPEAHRRELTLLCSRNALAADFERVINLLETGVVDTDPWVTHRASFDEVAGQFQRFCDPKSRFIKAVIEL